MIPVLVAAGHHERFARLVVANTGLPNEDQPMAAIWWRFREAITTAPELNIGWFVRGGCRRQLSDDARAGYDAPFPDDECRAGPRAMPGLVPTSPEDPAAAANKAAWAKLSASPTPMLVAFSDSDPITGPMAAIFQREMRGAQDIDHPTIRGAGHFPQEDAGEELANRIAEFLRR